MKLLVGKIGKDEVTINVTNKTQPNFNQFAFRGQWHEIGYDGQVAWYAKSNSNITQ